VVEVGLVAKALLEQLALEVGVAQEECRVEITSRRALYPQQ
jgi:hypothetical protein